MPKRWCKDCRQLFDMDSTGTLRCPACQATATTARQQRPNTTRRGYGSAHQQAKLRYLAAWQPGDACAHCQQPMMSSAGLDLAHTEDRTGYRGLAHAECNRGNR